MMLTQEWSLVALGYALVSRLAYVGYVAWSLRRVDLGLAGAGNGAYTRFRRRAAIVMYHDGVMFVALCVVTRGTLEFPLPFVWQIAGAALVALGVSVKVWAAATLGADGYYWRDFFEPRTRSAPITAGPYRWLKNPMYTVGYLQTYGLALLVASLPGLVASVFAQATIVAFYRLVERPHYHRLYGMLPATLSPLDATEETPG